MPSTPQKSINTLPQTSNDSLEKFMAKIEKEIADCEKRTEQLNRDTEEKAAQFQKLQEELISEELEGEITAKRMRIVNEMLMKREQDIEHYMEASKHSSETLDEIVSKHMASMEERREISNRTLAALASMEVPEELIFGNKTRFEGFINTRRENIISETTFIESELTEKQKALNKVNAELQRVLCPEISPEVKREVMEMCKATINEARKKLLEIKMENRTLNLTATNRY